MLGFLFLFQARDFPLALVGYYAKKTLSKPCAIISYTIY